MTKIHIISGFLGAGKTTLIKYLLEGRAGRGKVAIVENEFGQVGLDGALLRETAVNILEMSSGCICCSLAGDFRGALAKLLATYDLAEVIIEPSGVALLSDVKNACFDLVKRSIAGQKIAVDERGLRWRRQVASQSGNADAAAAGKGAESALRRDGVPPEASAADNSSIQLGGAITVVDAKKYRRYLQNFGDFFADQLKGATEILLTRTEMLTDAEKLRCVEDLRRYNQKARIHFTGLMSLSPEDWNHILLDGEKLPDMAKFPAAWAGYYDANAAEKDKKPGALAGGRKFIKSQASETDKAISGDLTAATAPGATVDSQGQPQLQGQHQASVSAQAKSEAPANLVKERPTFVSLSYKLKSCSVYKAEALRTALQAGAFGGIERCKGLVPLAGADGNPTDEWLHLEYAGGEWQRRLQTKSDRSVIIFIGTNINKDAVETFFKVNGLEFSDAEA